MLFVIALLGIAVFGVLLWCTITVARMRDLPSWRRFLPLALLLISLGASLLRAFDIPAVANAIAFPLNVAVIILCVREIRARRRRKAAPGSTD
ncbi:hypothetical protein [Streptomyces sp. fd1-xmd]|uniref:hypothetical protein n=1 Tax=Streptomyces sp. fd1-xmd TaxID=1812480 RepID=UPI0009908EB0|nr:hypothetical protein [Streptomyces sp. fd1-xmd]AQT70379.1 hypothetical protein B1K54_00130 [Streptomyces sp. fd1-xmd]